MLKFKKKASTDFLYAAAIRAISETSAQRGSDRIFDHMLFSRKAVEIFERSNLLITQAQADQIKSMRTLIKNNVNNRDLTRVFDFLAEVEANLFIATVQENKDMRVEIARRETFAGGYLLKFFENHGIYFDMDPRIRATFDNGYSATIDDFVTY